MCSSFVKIKLSWTTDINSLERFHDESLFFIFMTFFTTGLMAEISDGRRNTLISICDTAQKSSDLGTVRNIANQLKDAV